MMTTVSTEEFRKALDSLSESLEALDAQKDLVMYRMIRHSAIQRFEFWVELAWKTSLKKLGLKGAAPKPAIREMAQAGLIQDTEIWFDFVEARNKSSHTYAEEVAREVLDVAKKFPLEGERLWDALEAL